MSAYDYARERDDARSFWDYEDAAELRAELRAELEREEPDESESRLPSPYRCTDRMCGATDCSNCYPGRDGEEHDADDQE